MCTDLIPGLRPVTRAAASCPTTCPTATPTASGPTGSTATRTRTGTGRRSTSGPGNIQNINKGKMFDIMFSGIARCNKAASSRSGGRRRRTRHASSRLTSARSDNIHLSFNHILFHSQVNADLKAHPSCSRLAALHCLHIP